MQSSSNRYGLSRLSYLLRFGGGLHPELGRALEIELVRQISGDLFDFLTCLFSTGQNSLPDLADCVETNSPQVVKLLGVFGQLIRQFVFESHARESISAWSIRCCAYR